MHSPISLQEETRFENRARRYVGIAPVLGGAIAGYCVYRILLYVFALTHVPDVAASYIVAAWLSSGFAGFFTAAVAKRRKLTHAIATGCLIALRDSLSTWITFMQLDADVGSSAATIATSPQLLLMLFGQIPAAAGGGWMQRSIAGWSQTRTAQRKRVTLDLGDKSVPVESPWRYLLLLILMIAIPLLISLVSM